MYIQTTRNRLHSTTWNRSAIYVAIERYRKGAIGCQDIVHMENTAEWRSRIWMTTVLAHAQMESDGKCSWWSLSNSARWRLSRQASICVLKNEFVILDWADYLRKHPSPPLVAAQLEEYAHGRRFNSWQRRIRPFSNDDFTFLACRTCHLGDSSFFELVSNITLNWRIAEQVSLCVSCHHMLS